MSIDLKKSIHSELQTTSSYPNKRDYALTVYDKNPSAFLSLTALQNGFILLLG